MIFPFFQAIMANCLESLLQETSLSHQQQKPEKQNDILSEKLLAESNSENSNLLKLYRKINAKKRSKKSMKKKIELKPKLSMKDVLKRIDTKRVSNINKKLEPIAQRSKVAKKPPTKTVSSRAFRITASTNTNKAIGKWEDFVQTNRRAKFISFEEPRIKQIATADMATNFRPNSMLEKQLFGAVRDNANSLDIDDAEFSLAERRALEKLSLEDAKQRRTELKRFRILLSKYETKCKREKRIKSKNFHRLKRREKQKNTLFVQSPEQIDRMRARERVTLKHAQGSKWVRRLNKINFNDRNARKLLHNQKEMGRELKKHPESRYTIDSDSDIEPLNENNTISCSEHEQVSEFSFSTHQHQEPNPNPDFSEVNLSEPNYDDVPANFAYDDVIDDFAEEKEKLLKKDTPPEEGLPGWGRWANKDGNIETGKEKGEKKIHKKKQKEKELNAAQKERPDQPLVIINEERKDELRKHQVLQVPFPFHSRGHFETALNNPTGREWNTERNYLDKTKPRVSVPTGKIIPPAKRDKHKNKSK